MLFWILSLFYLLPSVAFLAAWPAAPRTCKNLENLFVVVGRKPYAAFSRSARSKRISEDTRSQHWVKDHPTNMTDGARKKINKRPFLRRKLVPKWTLEASGNVCGRRSATEGGKNVFWRPPGRSILNGAARRRWHLQLAHHLQQWLVASFSYTDMLPDFFHYRGYQKC